MSGNEGQKASENENVVLCGERQCRDCFSPQFFPGVLEPTLL